jgi:hypothetical protein
MAMKQGNLTVWLTAVAALGLACSSPKADTPSGDAAIVDTATLPDAVTETASSDATPGDVKGTDAVAPDVAPDVGPPVEVTYVTNVDFATDPTGAMATVGKNAQLSADIDVVYPPDNAMAPRDFAPITVQWSYTGTTANTFIVRFETEEAEIDVIGDASTWDVGQGNYDVTIPASIWGELFQYPDHSDWTVRVIAANLVSQQVVGTMQSSKPLTLHVTNQKVGGAIYYWNTTLATVRVLESGTLTPKSMPGITGGMFGCTGCHSVSPDGSTVAVSSFIGTGMASMGMQLLTGKSGTAPSWLSPKAASLLAGSFTIAAAFSPSYFSNNNRWLVVPSSGVLKSVNLLTGTSYKLVQSGDLGQQAFPTWSPNGETVVYASASDVGNGFSGSVATSLYSVPFGDGVDAGKGGIATPIAGADEPGIFHYYPAFTPDGAFIVYNRADPAGPTCPTSGGGGPSSGGGATTYDNCNAEVWMIAANGGTAIRLDNANQSTDPLTNSWPTFGTVTGQYYWMAFSSRRPYGFLHTGSPPSPQVYIAAVDPQKLLNGQDGSFAALWLPGQDISSGCHIARWSAPPRD